jgi:hypothetical protein
MTRLSVDQARQYASAAGFTGDALAMIVAIAQAESGLRTDARNRNTDRFHSVDRGILQINSHWHPEVSDACADDPACAFQAGFRISERGRSFHPWSTYTNGAYQQFLPKGVSWMQVDYARATPMWLPLAHSYDSNQRLFVVIHKTAGDATPHSVFTTLTQRRLSVHYGVGREGEVAQYIPESRGAWGNSPLEHGHLASLPGGDPNTYTISIEHCDPDGNNRSDLTAAQKAASFKLVADICRRNNIAPHNIIGHRDIEPISKPDCPGNYPLDELRAFVAAGGDMGVPSGWHDDGTTLRASAGGVPIVEGFRKYVLSHPWDPKNAPLGSEYGANPVEASYPQGGAGTRQDFHYASLGWTQQRGVYLIALGDEFRWYKHELAQLQQQAHAIPPTPA